MEAETLCPQTQHIPSGIKVPESEVIGNPRSSLPAHSPVEEGNLPFVECPVQGHFGKAGDGGGLSQGLSLSSVCSQVGEKT